MNRTTLEWYDLLARGLLWGAGIVFFLSLVGAVVIAGSETAVPLLEEAERQGRGFLALATLGGGLTSAGILGGLGALLRIQTVERLAKLPPEPERDPAPRRESRAKREEKPKREPKPKKPKREPRPKRESKSSSRRKSEADEDEGSEDDADKDEERTEG